MYVISVLPITYWILDHTFVRVSNYCALLHNWKGVLKMYWKTVKRSDEIRELVKAF